MTRRPRRLQQFSMIMAWLSFILAIVCGVFFYIKTQELGSNSPITASLLASMFFFVSVGVICFVMGKADVPDLRIRPKQSED